MLRSELGWKWDRKDKKYRDFCTLYKREGNFQNVGPAHKGPWRWDSKSHIKPLEGSNQGEDMSKSAFLKFPSGDSLVVRGLGLHVLTARGPDSIADGGTK